MYLTIKKQTTNKGFEMETLGIKNRELKRKRKIKIKRDKVFKGKEIMKWI